MRLFAKTAWLRSRSSTHVIAAPDAAPRLGICCALSVRSRARPRQWREALDRCPACAVYAHPLPRIIKAYKDAGERRLAPYLAELLYDTALHAQVVAPDRYGGVLSGADAVVFVPATAAAFRRRGFDHMEAIARPFCELSGVPLLDALVKYGHGDQRELGREERRERAQGMYETVEDVRGRRLLLIDDVITTGATMAAASAELKRAGAAAVDGLAIARVW